MKIKIGENIKGLIFDIDGTLADTMPIHYEAWRKVCSLNNFDFPEEIFYSVAGMPSKKIVPYLNEIYGLNLDADIIVGQKEEAFLDNIDRILPIEPVVEIVRNFHGQLPMSLGTGGRRDVALKTIQAVDLEKYFDILVSADDVENHKPAPDTFLKCANEMNVAPQFCQVFEDGDKGLDAAKKAGMTATDIRPYL